MSDSSIRGRLRKLPAAVDELARALAQAATTWGLGSALIGAFFGSGTLTGLRKFSLLRSANTTTHALFAIGGILLVLGVLVGLSHWRERSVRLPALANAARWFNPRFSWLVIPLFLFALDAHIEHQQPFKVLTFAAIAAAAAAISAYHWANANAAPERDANAVSATPRWRRWSIAWALTGLFAGYTAMFTRLSWNNLWGFNMARSDMGYYVSIFRHSSQGVPLGMSLSSSGTHLSGHFDPILVLLSPLYLIYPHAETILLLQAAWLGSGVFPVFFLARHFGCGNVGSIVLSVCYALYPALHGINLFDFHSIALAVPIIMWLLLFFEQGRKIAFFVTFALMLLVREDMALVACFVGLYALVSGKEHGRRWGWLVIGSALLWLVIIKGFVMTRSDLLMASDSSGSSSGGGGGKKPSGYTRFYADLIPQGGNTRALLATLIGKPMRVLNTLFKEEKVLYAVQILLPLSFLPLLAKSKRLLLVYGFAFTLLASRTYLHTIHFQYSAVLVPFVFPLAASVLGNFRRQLGFDWLPLNRRRLYAAGLASSLVLTGICSWKFGAIIPNTTFMAGFRPLVREPSKSQRRLAAWLKTVCNELPEGSTVAANSRMLAHLGNCSKIVLAEDRKRADYLIYRSTRNPLTKRVEADIKRGYLVEIDNHEDTIVYETRYGRNPRKPKSKQGKAKPKGSGDEKKRDDEPQAKKRGDKPDSNDEPDAAREEKPPRTPRNEPSKATGNSEAEQEPEQKQRPLAPAPQ